MGLPAKFDKEEFREYLESAKMMINEASEYGQQLAADFDTVVFVGCGAPNRTARLINHYVDLKVGFTRILSYLPAEFIQIDPQFIDNKRTVVVFGSYSGVTKETVSAARFCKNKECLAVSITRLDDSPLSAQVDHKLNYGDTKLGDYPQFILTSALVTGFLSVRESVSWDVHESMLESLQMLPDVLTETVDVSEGMIQTFSHTYHTLDTLLIVGHGPIYNIAYVLAFCSFMEMQKIHATPIIAADFFHGPFELLDDSLPVIVLIGEDETREEGLRVKTFCENYVEKYLVVDSKDYEMKGIAEELRGYFSSVVLDAATRRFMDYYAAFRNHDKSTRRYMGMVEY
jgi:fructoselysine 6-phosphate deglycase